MSEWFRSLKGYKYATKKAMTCKVIDFPMIEHEFFMGCNAGTILLVRPYYAWDGPSGPTLDGPTNMRASLFHDVLCQAIHEKLLGKKYRKYADQLFHKHLLEDGMSRWRAWCYYSAVRTYSRLKGM